MLTKRCAHCKLDLPLESFNKNVKKKDGLQYTCRDCGKLSTKKHYDANRDRYYEKNKRNVKLKQDYVLDIKKKSCCTECGEDRHQRLTFHHINSDEKENEVGHAAKLGWSIQRIQEEIDKCVVMCYNCHMHLHADERI